MTRVRAIEILRPGPPGEGMDPGQVEELEAFKERTSTQRYDVREWDFQFGDDFAAKMRNAIVPAVIANGGGIITGPAGHYEAAGGFTLADGVYLELPGAGNTHIDFSSATTSTVTNSACIYGAGARSTLPSLSTTANANDRTISFSSAPSLAPGDIIQIYNPANGSFFSAADYYRNGEFATVLSVSGTTVTLTRPLYATHPTTVTVYKCAMIRTGVSGARVTGIQGRRAITVLLGTQLRFHDLVMSGSNYSHLELKQCYNVRDIDGITAIDYSNIVSGQELNYGITVANSQSISIDSAYLETSRHGFVCTGDGDAGCIPNRDIRVSNSFLNGVNQGTIAGCNVHGNIEYYTFINCTMPNGFNPAGDHGKLVDCDISNGRGQYILYSGSLFGADHQFVNCRYRATRGHPANTGFMWLHFGNTGLDRTGGTVKVTGDLDLGPHVADSGTTVGLYIFNDGDAGDLPSDNHVDIDLIVRSTASPTGSPMWGASVRGRGGRGFRTVKMKVRGDLGGIINDTGSEVMDLSGSQVIDAPYRALQVNWPASGPYENGLIILDGVLVRRAYNTGIWIEGDSGGTDVTVLMDNVTSLDNNQSGGTTTQDSSMYVFRVDRVIRRDCIYGDTQGTTTQHRADSFNLITEVIDQDNILLGTVTTRYLNSITTLVYHGQGADAPTLACVDGSTYRRIGGGAGASFYVREGGAWVAK